MSAPWLTGWAYRVPLTIEYSKIESPLDDFPILLHLGGASGTNRAALTPVFRRLGASSGKIAVTAQDGTSQLYVEVVRWDAANREAYLWAKVPSVPSASNTSLYLYFDDTQADNTEFVGVTGTSAAQKVWDDHFVGVWHLAESGNGSAGEFKDSTGNRNDGQGGGGFGYASPTLTTAGVPMGVAQSFDGLNAYINVPDHDAFSVTTTGQITVSAWLSPASVNQPASAEGYTRWLGKSAVSNTEWQFVYYNQSYSTRSQWISYYNYSSKGGKGPGDYSTGEVPAESWVYVTGTSIASGPDHGIQHVYRNAAVHTGKPDDWQSYGLNYENGSAPVTIGTGWIETGNWWAGRIGEVRISDIARSDAWIAASYYAESDALVSYGLLQSQGAMGTPPLVTTTSAGPVGATGATIQGELDALGTAGGVSVGFRFGTTTSYGNEVDGVPASLNGSGTFSASLDGLAPDTTYHYQSVAVGDGIGYGLDRTFTTPAASGAGPLPTFGLDAGDARYASSMFNAQRFENTAGDGALSRLELLVQDASASGLVRLGVYADSDGVPGTLLIDAGEAVLTDGWVGISGMNMPVTAGTYYWLAYLPSSTVVIAYQTQSSAADSHRDYAHDFGPLPDSFGTGEVNSSPFVMRAHVTVAPPASAGAGNEALVRPESGFAPPPEDGGSTAATPPGRDTAPVTSGTASADGEPQLARIDNRIGHTATPGPGALPAARYAALVLLILATIVVIVRHFVRRSAS